MGDWEGQYGRDYRAAHKKENYQQLVLYLRKDGATGPTRDQVQARAAELGMTGAQYVVELIKKDMNWGDKNERI